MTENDRMLIAIIAPSCGGKTELAKRVAELAGESTATYSYDEHDLFPTGSLNLATIMQRGGPRHWENPHLFDNKAFLANLERWREGLPIILAANSRESMAAGIITREVRPQRLNIVEGVFPLYFPKAREQFDASFYIDIPEEEMIRRRLARTPKDSLEPWDSTDYITGPMVLGTRKYVTPQREFVKPENVLDGLQPTDVLARQVLTSLGYSV